MRNAGRASAPATSSPRCTRVTRRAGRRAWPRCSRPRAGRRAAAGARHPARRRRVIVRRERAADAAEIAQVVDAAFGDTRLRLRSRRRCEIGGLRARADVRRRGGRRTRRLHDAQRRARRARSSGSHPDADGRPARPAAPGNRRRDRAGGRCRCGCARRAAPPGRGRPGLLPALRLPLRRRARARSRTGGSRRRAWLALPLSPTSRPCAGVWSIPTSSRRRPVPELPEVERSVRRVTPSLEGRTFRRVEIEDVRLTRPGDPLEDRRGARRRARGAGRPARQVPDPPLRVRPRAPDPPPHDGHPPPRPASATHVRAVVSLDDGTEVGYRDDAPLRHLAPAQRASSSPISARAWARSRAPRRLRQRGWASASPAAARL